MPKIVQHYRVGGYARRPFVSVARFLFTLTKNPDAAVKKIRSAWILFTAVGAVKIKKKAAAKYARGAIFLKGSRKNGKI
jgi:hypothetical protein